MAKTLKTNGVADLNAVIRRVRRQHSLLRIEKKDADSLIEELNAVISHILRMPERDETGEEAGNEWL